VRAVARVPRERLRLVLRHGLAAVARPGADTAGAIVAIGLGVLVVLAMNLVQGRLAEQLDGELPVTAPSAFFIDVQPEQWPELEGLLRSEGATEIDAVPVVMARLRAVDGVEVADLAGGGNDGEGRERWALTREQRLTVLDVLPDDNELVAGELWSDPARDEVSVEVDFARSIGAGLGSVLRLDVQGVPVELVVTSLRRVEWRTFRINFFLAVEPGVLDGAPQWRLAAARVPREREQSVQDRLAELLPNVTTVPIREVLEKVSGILGRLGLGVRFLGAFTVLAGIAILGGAASASASRRGREVALLKTLGFTRSGVVSVVAVEYGLVGLVAGVLGAAGGVALAWALVVHGFDLPWRLEPLPVVVAAGGASAITVIAGLVACVRALRIRPLAALRSE
jgi:putative ABC transport system permease protein